MIKKRKPGRPRVNHKGVIFRLDPKLIRLIGIFAGGDNISRSEFVARAVSERIERIRKEVLAENGESVPEAVQPPSPE